MEEKILHRFDVFAEQAHSGAPVFGFAFSLIERVERTSRSERLGSRSLADCAKPMMLRPVASVSSALWTARNRIEPPSLD
jgi:hypothetical protein